MPDDVHVSAIPGGGVRITPGPLGVQVLPLWEAEPVESFACNILRDAQDHIIEHICKRDWPPLPEGAPEPSPGATVRAPHTEVIGREIHWWYGERETPLLRVPPGPLA